MRPRIMVMTVCWTRVTGCANAARILGAPTLSSTFWKTPGLWREMRHNAYNRTNAVNHISVSWQFSSTRFTLRHAQSSSSSSSSSSQCGTFNLRDNTFSPNHYHAVLKHTQTREFCACLRHLFSVCYSVQDTKVVAFIMHHQGGHVVTNKISYPESLFINVKRYHIATVQQINYGTMPKKEKFKQTLIT